MRTSWLAAGIVVIALVLWMASGMLKPSEAVTIKEKVTEAPMSVEIQVLDVETMDKEITLQGQLEPAQHLFLKAETSGVLKQFLVDKGMRVKQGDTILRLDVGGRENTLAEARARVKSARSEHEAAKSLRKQRLQSQVQLEQAEATLEAALAQLATIQRDINNTNLIAPFDAIVNNLPIEVGTLVERGDGVAELINDSWFNISAQASQQSLASLKIGQPITVDLITGQKVTGELTYISSIANPQTRSFTVEGRIANETGTIAAGISATMHIPVEQVEATFITPSALSLGDDGELGVKAVDSNNQVVFLPITLVSTSLDGAWVSGIDAGTRIITMGQGFVNAGETVDARPAESGTH